MYLFKTSGSTFDSVITNQKHAFKGMPSDWSQGETVLVSKNLADCASGEKQIQYTMKIHKIRPATQAELESLWPGNKNRWKYIADCYDTTKLSITFNLDDILGDESKVYSPVMTFKKITSPHEQLIHLFIQKHINPSKGRPQPEEEVPNEYDPSSEDDARKRVISSIVIRRGQPAFRNALICAYEGKCAITGCDAIDALEAAHITPYMGVHTNSVNNGLLLRADIHTLFDLGKIAISPVDFKVLLHRDLRNSHYADLQGKMISVPKVKNDWPSIPALQKHKDNSGL